MSSTFFFPSMEESGLVSLLDPSSNPEDDTVKSIFSLLDSIARLAITVSFHREHGLQEDMVAHRHQMRDWLATVGRTIRLLDIESETYINIARLDAPDLVDEMVKAIAAARDRLMRIATVLAFFTRTSDRDLPIVGQPIAPLMVDIYGQEWDVGTVFEWMILSPDRDQRKKETRKERLADAIRITKARHEEALKTLGKS